KVRQLLSRKLQKGARLVAVHDGPDNDGRSADRAYVPRRRKSRLGCVETSSTGFRGRRTERAERQSKRSQIQRDIPGRHLIGGIEQELMSDFMERDDVL